jgi:hypothetical protein
MALCRGRGPIRQGASICHSTPLSGPNPAHRCRAPLGPRKRWLWTTARSSPLPRAPSKRWQARLAGLQPHRVEIELGKILWLCMVSPLWKAHDQEAISVDGNRAAPARDHAAMPLLTRRAGLLHLRFGLEFCYRPSGEIRPAVGDSFSSNLFIIYHTKVEPFSLLEHINHHRYYQTSVQCCLDGCDKSPARESGGNGHSN